MNSVDGTRVFDGTSADLPARAKTPHEDERFQSKVDPLGLVHSKFIFRKPVISWGEYRAHLLNSSDGEKKKILEGNHLVLRTGIDFENKDDINN